MQPSNIPRYFPLKPVFIHIAHYCPVGRVILILPGFLPTLSSEHNGFSQITRSQRQPCQ